ncbi:unnamed protein product [Durusdinium trenchii]|uniref:Uncharacterized protein n=2 Tax=Durusdinium trenchii TaxID=1381693 RepID=A0ABP0IMU8_9DINO
MCPKLSNTPDQEWKSGSPLFEGFRKYDPELDQKTEVKLDEFPLRFCHVTQDTSKKGTDQFTFSLPHSVRVLYMNDPLRAEEWKKLISDFDDKFHIGKVEQSIVPVPTEPERAVEPWRNEPKDLNELLENYIIENKFPSSIAGGMLYLTRSETRSGEKIDLIDDQKSKLFFDPCLRISWGSVAHMDISLGENESVISHGKSKWLNHDKMAKFLREGLLPSGFACSNLYCILICAACCHQDIDQLLNNSPENLVTPPTREIPGRSMSRNSASSALTPTAPQSLPLHSSSTRGNPPLDAEAKRSLAIDLEKARGKLKEDKNAAKSAVKAMRAGLSKPGKSDGLKDKAKGGRGRGRGKGRGRGRKAAKETEEDEMDLQEEEEEEQEDEEMNKLQEMLEGIEMQTGGQDVDSEQEEEEEDEVLEDEPKNGKGASGPKKATRKKKELTLKEVEKQKKMQENKKKRQDKFKESVRKINAKAAATSKELKKKYNETQQKSNKRARPATAKGDEDANQASASSSAAGLKDAMHKHIKEESDKLKKQGMSAKEALAAARKSWLSNPIRVDAFNKMSKSERGDDETEDGFQVKPKEKKVLIKSRTLFRAWRVGYVEAENEISPRKPLYFWRDNYKGIRLSQNTCLRLL